MAKSTDYLLSFIILYLNNKSICRSKTYIINILYLYNYTLSMPAHRIRVISNAACINLSENFLLLKFVSTDRVNERTQSTLSGDRIHQVHSFFVITKVLLIMLS